MPSNSSWGVFTSPSIADSLPKEDRELFFRTTSRQNFAGEKPSPLGRCQSFGDVHEIGQRRTTHLGWRLKLAELPDRRSCAYNHFFDEKSLDDSFVNKQLAKCFNREHKVASLPALSSTTAYGEAFACPSRSQLRHARGKCLCPKERTSAETLGFSGGHGEVQKRSFSQSVHQKPVPGMSTTCSKCIVKETLGLPFGSIPDAYKTWHRVEFQKFDGNYEPKQPEVYPGLQ